MNHFRKIFLLPLYCLIAIPVSSQEYQDEQKTAIIEERIELLAEQNERENIDYTTLFDELSYYYDHPINLNHTDENTLRSLYLLNDLQIHNLFHHIKKQGKLINLYELQVVEGFDTDLIRAIRPFVRVGSGEVKPHIGLAEMFRNGSNEIFIRHIRVLEEMQGYEEVPDSVLASNPNKKYLGSPDRLYLRYRYRFGTHVSWGITAEKDAGEEFFQGTQKRGFDYYSSHLYLRDIGRLKHLALGDYQIQLGQGLSFWSGLAFGKSSDAMAIKKNPATIKPYTSVDENRFLRGVAASVHTGALRWTGFISDKSIDANVSQDSLNQNNGPGYTSFTNSGYHRTPDELNDKHAVGESIIGGQLMWVAERFNIGASLIRSKWDGVMQKQKQLYNQFEFDTSSLLNIGVNYNCIWRNVNFFGEIARSDNGGIATINGALAALDSKMSLVIAHRNYQRTYQGVYVSGFGESSKTSNEQGIYIGTEANPVKHWRFSAYFDSFRFPWLKYQVDAPSKGVDYMLQCTWEPSRKTKAYLRYREEIKQRNDKETNQLIDVPAASDLRSLRLHLSTKLNDDFRIRNRVEFKSYQKTYSGFLIFQDIMYKSLDNPWAFTFRYALFQTDSYDTRIYAYENEILYYYSIPAYYYRGMRTYLILKYSFNKGIEFWFRIARTIYTDRDEIGSGLSTISANHKTEVKTQLRIRF